MFDRFYIKLSAVFKTFIKCSDISMLIKRLNLPRLIFGGWGYEDYNKDIFNEIKNSIFPKMIKEKNNFKIIV